jgi:hypothetical protein
MALGGLTAAIKSIVFMARRLKFPLDLCRFFVFCDPMQPAETSFLALKS